MSLLRRARPALECNPGALRAPTPRALASCVAWLALCVALSLLSAVVYLSPAAQRQLGPALRVVGLLR